MKKHLITLLALIATLTVSASSRNDIPLLDAAPFDTIIDGKKVALYTISNGKVAAQITNYGGFLVSLYAPDRDDNYTNLVTGYKDVAQYTHYSLGAVGPMVGRYANRIANASFTLDGTTYKLTANTPPHTLHAGRNGFDHTVWTVVKHNKNKLVLCCISPDGTDGFPGTLTTTLTYSITKDNGLSLVFESKTDKATVVSTTCHSYFNLNGADSGDVLGHFLMVHADSITETDRANIPTGRLLCVEGTAYDLRSPVQLSSRTFEPVRQTPPPGATRTKPVFEIPDGKVLFYDNNFCVKHVSSTSVDKVAELYSENSGRVMEVWSNHPGLQVYTGGRRTIALESQMYPDSPNHPEFPSTVLRPGQKYSHTCIYKFRVK